MRTLQANHLPALIASMLIGCATAPHLAATQPARGPVDPTDAAAITSRLRAILPAGWHIVRTERDTYPSYRPEGKGIAVFFAPADLGQLKTDSESAVYVMPPDYIDGGEDPNNGKAQQRPPPLVAATPEMKIYVWGRWNDAQDPSTESQVIVALLK